MAKARDPLGRLWAYLRRYWLGYLLGGSLQISAEAAVRVILAWMLAGLTENALHGSVQSLLSFIALSLLGLSAVALAIPGATRWCSQAVEQAAADLRADLFGHLQQVRLSYLEQTHSGDSVSRLTTDLTTAKETTGVTLIQIISALVTGITCGLLLCRISWKFTIVAFALGCLPLFFNRIMGGRIKEASTKVQQSMAGLNSRLKDLLTGYPMVKAFGLEDKMVGLYGEANANAKGYGLQRAQLQALVVAVNDQLGWLNFLVMLALGSYLMIRGEVTAGETMAAVQLLNGFRRPFAELGDLWVKLQTGRAAAGRLFELLDQECEGLPGVVGSAAATGEELSAIRFEQVEFAYDSKQVLDRLSLEVASGQVVALVGPSGGGKSTVCKLLLGFYQATGGRITVAGRDLNSYTLDELRRRIAFVPQEAYLFTGTIYENIACGRLGASRAEVEAAARAANAHDFIVELPQGYDTEVGERGTQLSGGQRQRIAIARALLKDAPILLLDEATSSLDSESERLVQEALERLMLGRTTLVIAHRLSTIRHADCIHVVVAGRVVESGTHDDLMALEGVYRRMHDVQPVA